MSTMTISAAGTRFRRWVSIFIGGYERFYVWMSRPTAVCATIVFTVGALFVVLGDAGWTLSELGWVVALTFEGVAALPAYAQAGLAAATVALVAAMVYARRNPGWADHLAPAGGALMYLALNVADILTTVAAITWLGAVEHNGAMAAVISEGWWVFITVKMLAASALASVFWLSKRGRWMMVFALTVTSIVVLNNAIAIARDLLYP